MRSYLRERDELVTARSTQPQHRQQALAQMNVPLTQMRSDRNGQSGLASIGAILTGGRNPLALAVELAQLPDQVEVAQRPLPAQADPKKPINETLRLGLYRKLGRM